MTCLRQCTIIITLWAVLNFSLIILGPMATAYVTFIIGHVISVDAQK